MESPAHLRRIRVQTADETLQSSGLRRRLENALQAAVDVLSRGSRDAFVRRTARRLATTLDAMDEDGDRHERPRAA
jgi:hypothetical protein